MTTCRMQAVPDVMCVGLCADNDVTRSVRDTRGIDISLLDSAITVSCPAVSVSAPVSIRHHHHHPVLLMRDPMHKRGVWHGTVFVCLSVCLSVTFVHYIERCIRLFSSPSGSPIFYTEYYGEIPTGSPVTGHDLYVAEIYRPRAIYEMPSFSYLFRILKIAYGIKYSNVCLFDKYNQITSARPLTVA